MNCPECGHKNPFWCSSCEQCGKPLPDAVEYAQARARGEIVPDTAASSPANNDTPVRTEAAPPSAQESLPKSKPVTCPNCGYVGLPTYRNTCASCDSRIDPAKYAQSATYRRQQEAPGCVRIYAVLLGIGAFIGVGSAFTFIRYNPLFFFLLLGLALAQGFAAFGLYDMKKWGHNLAIIVLGIGLLFDLLSFSIITMVIRGYVLFWLLNNEQLFSK